MHLDADFLRVNLSPPFTGNGLVDPVGSRVLAGMLLTVQDDNLCEVIESQSRHFFFSDRRCAFRLRRLRKQTLYVIQQRSYFGIVHWVRLLWQRAVIFVTRRSLSPHARGARHDLWLGALRGHGF